MITKLIKFIENFKWDKDNVASDNIIPPQFVYHLSDKENRYNILQKGLKPSVGESYKSWTNTENSIPAIFATISRNYNDIIGSVENFPSDIWQIDTLKINNEWFIDKHFEFLKEYGHRNPHIVTFDPISNTAIKLVHKQK
jgi:hypothetical protein